MTNTIAAVMRECRNYFERSAIEGEISITGGVVSPQVEAPYVYIKGSAYHEGVHRLEQGSIVSDSAADESFTGCVWLLYPPSDFIELCRKVSDFEAKTPVGALQSESLNEYSYTRATGSRGVLTWQEAYASSFIPYRRMFTEVG